MYAMCHLAMYANNYFSRHVLIIRVVPVYLQLINFNLNIPYKVLEHPNKGHTPMTEAYVPRCPLLVESTVYHIKYWKPRFPHFCSNNYYNVSL